MFKPRKIVALWFGYMTDQKNMAICVLAVLIAAYTGPFGTWSTMGGVERAVFWGGILVWSFVASTFTVAVACNSLNHVPLVLQKILSCLFFTLIFAPPLYLALRLYIGASETGSFVWIAIISFGIALVVAALRQLLQISARSELAKEMAEEQERVARSEPRLLSRLNDDPGPVLRISARDHFVHVVTETGEHDIRMRLGDAVAEMEGVEGFYTHRSHWVARKAITNVLRDGTKTYVVSPDQHKVPVSRTYLPELENAGLF